ncbi:MAG: hypothetical protein IPH16_00570 [Haliscomenobacter sp.]|nr:hypothetical protein [Haliscomenobacter sp.]
MVWFFSTIYTASYWLVVRSIMVWKRRRFPRQEETMKRIVTSLLTIIPFFFAFNFIMDIIQDWAGAPGHAKIPHWQYYVTSAFIIIFISALYESVYLLQPVEGIAGGAGETQAGVSAIGIGGIKKPG